MKNCPHCAQQIPDNEAICRECARAIQDATAPSRPTPRPPGQRANHMLLAAIGLGGLMAGAAVMMLIRQPSTEGESGPALIAPSAAPNSAGLPAAASGSPGATKWSGDRKARRLNDGSRMIAFELAAENEVPVWMRRARPVLVVQCLSGQTDVIVVTDSAPTIEGEDGKHTVRVRFDDGADTMQQWSASDDYQALLAPEGVGFARQIAGARLLHFGFTPHNAPPVTADFDVRGFDELIEAVAATCKWKP